MVTLVIYGQGSCLSGSGRDLSHYTQCPPVEKHHTRKDHSVYNNLLDDLCIKDSCGFYEYPHILIEKFKDRRQ